MSKLSVIIVNYNTRDVLKKCLENLMGKYPDMEVIVVDNDSTDDSVQMVRREFPVVILIESKNNGLAAGYNLGVDKSVGDYILYLGSDAFPGEDTLLGIVNYLGDNPNVGIATAKLVLRDGSMDKDCHRGFPTPWAALTHFLLLERIFPSSRFLNQYFLGYEDLNKPHEIDLCVSHFMLMRKKVLDDVGRWDESFFVYGEDVDMCYRAKKAGWKIMYLPQWMAMHVKGVSVGIRKESEDVAKVSVEHKKKMRAETTRAMALFYNKHYSGKYPKLLTGLVIWGIKILSIIRGVIE